MKAKPASYNSIKLTWKAVAGRTRYGIYRSTAIDGVFTLVGTTTAQSYMNKNVDTGTPYFFKVCAYRNAVPSGFSTIVTATASLATPTKVRARIASHRS